MKAVRVYLGLRSCEAYEFAARFYGYRKYASMIADVGPITANQIDAMLDKLRDDDEVFYFPSGKR